MKPTVLLTLAAALASFTASAQQLLDRTRLDGLPTVAATAVRPTATNAYNQVRVLEQIYRAGAWKDTFRTSNSRFNSAGVPARVLRETSANGSTWTSTRRNQRQFNAAGAILLDTTYSFNAMGVGTPRFAKANTYNAAGKLTQSLLRWQLSTWQNYGRDTYTYDAQGYLTELLLEGYANGFYNSARTLYTNNAQGLPVVIEDQQDNGSGTAWLPAQKDLITYNPAGQVVIDVTQTVPNGATTYQNFRREVYNYDPNVPTRVTSTTVDVWQNGAWVQAGQNVFAYDANDNLQSLTTQVAVGGGNFRDYYRYLYTYAQVLGTTASRTLQAGLTVAPNPVALSGTVTLRYELPTAAPVSVSVLDLAGREVLSLPAAAQTAGAHQLMLPQLPTAAGLYLLRLSAGSQSQTVKLRVE